MIDLLEEHFRTQYKASVALAYAICQQDAEDAVQEAYVRALTYQHTFNPDIKDLNSWMAGIIRNAALDERLKAKGRISEEYVLEEGWEYSLSEDQEKMFCLLEPFVRKSSRYSEEEKSIIVMSLYGLKVRDILKLVDPSVNRARVEKVLELFRNRLKKLGEEYEWQPTSLT